MMALMARSAFWSRSTDEIAPEGLKTRKEFTSTTLASKQASKRRRWRSRRNKKKKKKTGEKNPMSGKTTFKEKQKKSEFLL
jgi:hypothetical protein